MVLQQRAPIETPSTKKTPQVMDYAGFRFSAGSTRTLLSHVEPQSSAGDTAEVRQQR